MGALLGPALAGLLLVALLLCDASGLPAAAAELPPPDAASGQALAAGLPAVPAATISAEPLRAGDAWPAAEIPTTDAHRPAAPAPQNAWDTQGTATPAAAASDAANAPTPTHRQSWPELSTAPARAGTALSLPVAETVLAMPTASPTTAPEGQAEPPSTPLERRLQQWPAWRLPAPLARPGSRAPTWPAWFSGEWQVESVALPADPDEPLQPGPPWRARFRPDGHGGAEAERAFNAFSVGRSLLGERLLSVQDDPAHPNRQLARLTGEQLLETSLIGQRGERPEPTTFLNDELSLQVLHGPGEPQLSRIETLGRWRLLPDGSIAGEQWQARYASPSEGLRAGALTTERFRLRLVPVPPGSDPAS